MSIVRQWRQRQRKGFADDGCRPPEGRSPLHPFSIQGAIVVLSVLKRESGTELQKVSCCVQGPGETSETWTYPSMVLVPLCTATVMAWPIQVHIVAPQGLTVVMWQPGEDHCTCDRNFQNAKRQDAVCCHCAVLIE